MNILSMNLFSTSHDILQLCTMASHAGAKILEYKFVSEPDKDLKCVICFEVARDPLQHEECGKLFCKGCLENYGKGKPCPNCRKKGSQYFRDNKSECIIIMLDGIIDVRNNNRQKKYPSSGSEMHQSKQTVQLEGNCRYARGTCGQVQVHSGSLPQGVQRW